MSNLHKFGGRWTEEKLDRLRKYLPAYMIIMKQNIWASRHTTTYIDAFAGSGGRTSTSDQAHDMALSLFDQEDIDDINIFYKGSARIALEVEPPFDRYLFIEQNPHFVQELEGLREEYPARADRIQVLHHEANSALRSLCTETDWRRNRAVAFLDPYGMAVEWSTLEITAATRAVDLWILLPVGQAINRMLPRQGPPIGAWAEKLTITFGTDSWLEHFYRPPLQQSMFAELGETFEKQANVERISEYFIERLKTIFAGVSEEYLVLLNSRNVPLFVLFFAAANPRAAPTAVGIAEDILLR